MRTYGINVNEHYQKYDPKARAGDKRISDLEFLMKAAQEWKKQVQGRFRA